MMRAALLTLAVITVQTVAHAGDDAGRITFNTYCRNCHSIKAGDNRLGPSLHAVFGSKAGQVAGYGAYSGSLKGLVWDAATLDRFIANPTSVAPNTSMRFPPVGDPTARAKIIEFLQSQASR